MKSILFASAALIALSSAAFAQSAPSGTYVHGVVNGVEQMLVPQTGSAGPAGPAGAAGAAGSAATVAVGSTTTAAPGNAAVVSNVGTPSAAVLNFTIPQGAAGSAGPAGATGATGQNGAAATVAIGSITTASPGSAANVSNTGTPSAAVLNFTIPQGATGQTGPQGPAGSGGSSQSLVANFPDVLLCTGADGSVLPMIAQNLPYPNSGSPLYIYDNLYAPTQSGIMFNPNGTWNSDSNGTFANCHGTIASLVAAGQTRNFGAGGGGSGTQGPAGPQGPAGATGPQGPQGPAGPVNSGLISTPTLGAACSTGTSGYDTTSTVFLCPAGVWTKAVN